MPAAAVIPAPIAYIKVVAVKKLVVGFLGRWMALRLTACVLSDSWRPSSGGVLLGIRLLGRGSPLVYCEKIRVFKAGLGR